MSRKSALRRTAKPLRIAVATPAQSLDPEDWGHYRQEAHKALDAALDHVANVRDRPVWRQVPDRIKAEIAGPVPWPGQGLGATLEDARRLILPYTVGNTHPRFFGWVHGSGTAGGIVSEMLAAAMNVNAGGREHAAVYVERQVIEWAKEIFDFPKAAGGLLVSGTSMATLIALTAARDSAGRADSRKAGVQGRRLVGYASGEAHASIAKAFEILGLGRDALRLVPVDRAFRMNVAELERQISADRAAGFEPFAIVATAGTVNTAATDPLAAIAKIARSQKLWLHVDGAFGALARLSPETRGIVAGLEKAQSIAFDFHKWLHVPYDAGAVLIRDGAKLRQSFSSRPDYLKGAERGLAAGEPWYCELGPELSRGFRAFKVWFTLKEHGLERLGEKIADNCRQARYLASLVDAHPDLELLAPVALNIVCFRYRSTDDGLLDQINGDIVVALQEKGIAAPSTTRIAGKLAIRVNLTNHRTADSDLELLVEAVLAEARARTNLRSMAAPEKQRPGPAEASRSIAHAKPRKRSQPRVTPEARSALEMARAEPGIAALLAGQTLGIGDTGTAPFVASADRITIAPGVLHDKAALHILLRHAAEVSLWQRLTGDQLGLAWQAAVAVAGLSVTSSYMSTLPEPLVRTAMSSLPDRLGAAYRAMGKADRLLPLDLLLGRGAPDLEALLALQGLEPRDITTIMAGHAIRTEAVNLLGRLDEVVLPAEAMLLSGGDPRIVLDVKTAMNGYGASPRPMPGEINFASSTASSLSPTGFAAVEALRQRLIANAIDGDLSAGCAREASTIRDAIGRYIGTQPRDGTAVVLSASGTDTAFAALALAKGDDPRPIVSLYFAPEETGSGIPKAAAGCHFLGRTSLGHTVTAGTVIEGLGGTSVQSQAIAVRHASGRMRELAAIDADVASHIAAILASGRRCLLHVLDAAKTGIGAPSPELIQRLQAQHGDRLDVVVDACQMRISPTAIRAHLSNGCMVQITGSKFFAGPAFSGALLVPARITRSARALPVGLGLYCGRIEWPPALDGCASGLPETRNLGILARWQAALDEISRFQSVPSSDADRLLAQFAAEITEAIRQHPNLTLVEAGSLDRSSLDATRNWTSVPTILSYTLATRRHGKSRVLTMDEMKRVHRWMLLDLSMALPVTPSTFEQRAAATRCHVGQPVKIAQLGDQSIGALRLCSSARIVTQTMLDRAGGATAADRFSAILDQARLVLDKSALIARHFDVLARSLAS